MKFYSLSPYPGLRPFTEKESIFFKGREKHIDKIVKDLEEKHFLMVTGASGDGKSSMVFAGVIPQIKAGFFKAKYNKWIIAVFRPGSNPLNNISLSLSKQFKYEKKNIMSNLELGYSALIELYKNSEFYHESNVRGANLLLVVDQFEEFFANKENYNKDTGTPSIGAQTIINLLIETTRIAVKEDIPVYIISTMRSDYIGHAPIFRGLPELVGTHQYFVPRLSREELLDVISQPAVLCGKKISMRLAQRMLNDLNEINLDALPVLQHAMKQIWIVAKSGSDEMDLVHFCMVGGMYREELPNDQRILFEKWLNREVNKKQDFYDAQKHAYSQKLENVLNLHANRIMEFGRAFSTALKNMPNDEFKRISQAIFKCLTKVDELKPVRNRMHFKTVCEIINLKDYSKHQIEEVINIFRLPQNTLIFPFMEDDYPNSLSLKDESLLDITHEALIRNWQLLRKWAMEENQSVIDFKELNSHVKRWMDSNMGKSQLLSVGTYDYFNKWNNNINLNLPWIKNCMDDTDENKINKTTIPDLSSHKNDNGSELNSKDIYENILAYLDKSKAQIFRKKIFQKRIFTTIIILAFIACIGLSYVFYLKNQISKIAYANDIATLASNKLNSDPTLSFRLAEQAYKIYPTPLSKQIILSSYTKSPYYQMIRGPARFIDAKFSPDGSRIITTHNGETPFVLWDNNGNEIKFLDGYIGFHQQSIYLTDISNDSKKFLTGTDNGYLRIYDKHGNLIYLWTAHKEAVSSVFYSEDNQYMISSSEDSTVNIWSGPGELTHTITHNARIILAKFSSKRNFIFSLDEMNNLMIWDKNIKLIKHFNNAIALNRIDINFSPDEKYIAFPVYDNELFIYDIKNDTYKRCIGHKDVAWTADFSPDNRFVVSSSIDKTAKLWDLNGNLVASLEGHQAKLWNAKFSNNGTKIATVSDDCTARIWDMEGMELHTLRGHTSQIFNANFSSDDLTLITSSNDYTTRIWNLKLKENSSLRFHYSWVDDATFSNNGNTIATCGYDYTAKLWSKDGLFQKSLIGHQEYGVYSVIFSNDDKFILTTGLDKTARIWNLDGQEVSVLKMNEIPYIGKFSGDNKYVLTLGYSKSPSIWNLNGRIVKKFEESLSADISNFTNIIAVSEKDSTLSFYDIKELSESHHKPILKTEKFSSKFEILKFSNDDKFLIATTENNQLYIWSISTEEETNIKLISTAKAHEGVIKSLNFSKDSKFFVTASGDNKAKIWDINGKLKSVLTGHSDILTDAEFSNDNKHVVTSSYDFSVRVWDINGNCLQIITAHNAAVVKAKFSPDGNFILTASNDQTALLMPWKVEDVLNKINVEMVRGEVWEMSEKDKEVYGINIK